jgi:DNA-binding transcriptional LysR family regulator
MDERQLRSFIAVCRSGSLVSASKQLNISQSALSRRLAELQSQLGVTLFEAHGRGIQKTADANRLFPLALNALDACSTLRNEAKQSSPSEEIVPLKIAATPHTIEGAMASLAVSYRRARPNVEISFIEAGGAEVQELVLRGDATLGISARPDVETGLSEQRIARLDFVAMSREPFSERQSLKGVDLKSIYQQDLILLDRRFQARLILDAAFRLLNLSPRIIHEGGSTGVIKSLAATGVGTAILLSNSISELPNARIVARGTQLGLDLTAVWEPATRWRAEVEEFVQMLRTDWPLSNTEGQSQLPSN